MSQCASLWGQKIVKDIQRWTRQTKLKAVGSADLDTGEQKRLVRAKLRCRKKKVFLELMCGA